MEKANFDKSVALTITPGLAPGKDGREDLLKLWLGTHQSSFDAFFGEANEGRTKFVVAKGVTVFRASTGLVAASAPWRCDPFDVMAVYCVILARLDEDERVAISQEVIGVAGSLGKRPFNWDKQSVQDQHKAKLYGNAIFSDNYVAGAARACWDAVFIDHRPLAALEVNGHTGSLATGPVSTEVTAVPISTMDAAESLEWLRERVKTGRKAVVHQPETPKLII